MRKQSSRDCCSDDRASDRVRINPALERIIAQRFSRRDILKLAAGLGGLTLLRPVAAMSRDRAEISGSTLTFPEVRRGADANLHVAEGYRAEVLIRWGDPILSESMPFDPLRQSAASQSASFGYNNDFLGFVPFPGQDHRAMLLVNHEFTQGAMMFPGSPAAKDLSKEQVDIEIAAHGASLVELERESGRWKVCRGSIFNRRISPWTPMRFDGPAAGSARLHTPYSKSGYASQGTYANCGGGLTPWGTVLSAEENIHFYFYGSAEAGVEAENHSRLGIQSTEDPRFHWGRFYERWNLDKNPREPLHVGWIVEIDPFDPESIPVKHTALGRFKHEACSLHINRDGRLVVFLGDDQYFEYIYRYVSNGCFKPNDCENNRQLLREGVLSVAEFKDDGALIWHPLEYGRGPLTATNGFHCQADVLIDTRKAADLVGATPMDRPEDVEVNPMSGEVFVMLTKNPKRGASQVNRANPRAGNTAGHIVTLKAPDKDYAFSEFRWEIFLLAGDPDEREPASRYPAGLAREGWFQNPDNCTFDREGRLWLATDGNQEPGEADGVWACDTDGPARAITRRFIRLPFGAEATGPCFSPDHQTFFLSVQHPGDGSSFDDPSTRWPDFDSALPPRPAVIAVYRDDNGVVGS
ncbi:MAG: PhoX family phosphatase [Methylococcaceae bacterium]|nr:PhoX family phosphatase [Methylococcaceae bacterium]